MNSCMKISVKTTENQIINGYVCAVEHTQDVMCMFYPYTERCVLDNS